MAAAEHMAFGHGDRATAAFFDPWVAEHGPFGTGKGGYDGGVSTNLVLKKIIKRVHTFRGDKNLAQPHD
tara:strand:+ start:232 stop:438 length:207 start_codon:yes stop_codon:yes gene_type:complete